MELPEYFISCDWGTSNFRLRLAETQSLNILVEHKTNQGIKSLFQSFKEQSSLNQTEFFISYLRKQVNNLGEEYRDCLIVASGMASSNIGVMELKYGDMPFDENGKGIYHKLLSFEKESDILLISGIKDDKGMMRGEEIQAIGLSKFLKSYQRGVLVLPGTHSKHIKYETGEFSSLKSFMTGELFDLLSTQSILSNNVESCQWIGKRRKAFLAGAAVGLSQGLSENLFSIRANHLIGDANKKDNFYRLSGMFIGDELSYFKNYKGTIFLAASQPFFDMYSLVLNSILKPDQVVCFDNTILENALLIGQRKILESYGQ